MPWTHVVAPNVGLVTNIAPTALPPGASPNIQGCYLKQGQVITDYGFVDFPTPSNTQSNQLIGTIMTLETLNLSSGIEYLLCFTTSFLYYWNTQSMTWNNITQGVYIDTGGDTWTAEANVTASNSTAIFIYGAASTELTIGAGFTTGIIGYKNFSAINASATNLTNIAFWIYSTINLAAGVLGVRLSAQNAGGTGAVYATYAVPAIIANTWTQCTVLLDAPVAASAAFVPSDLTAILSVSLIAITAPGVCSIYINDIQTNQCFQGDTDNRFSFDVIYDTGLISNGVDVPSQVIDNGGPVHSTMTLTLPTGAITSSEVVRAFRDHVLFMNNTENGASVPQRVTWTNIGTILDLVDGTSGYQDLTDNQDDIVGAEIFSEVVMLVYKENSTVACSWVGGQTPFRFDPLVYGYGALSKDSICLVEGYHVVIDNGDIYVGNSTPTPQAIDAPIQQQLYNQLNGDYVQRTFTRFNKIDNEIEFYICYEDTTPDVAYVFNQVDTNWTVRNRNISGWGEYQTQSYVTIAELIGTIAQQNFTFGSQTLRSYFPITLCGDVNGLVYQINKSSIMNGANPIVSEFDTPDFVCPASAEVSWSGQTDYVNRNMRVCEIVFEAMGTSITVQYSIDGGLSWNPCQGGMTNAVTLTSIYTEYELFFETDAKTIRFRFSGGPFSLRYYGFYWMLRTGRR